MKINTYFTIFLAIFICRNIIEPNIKPIKGKVAQGKTTLAIFIVSYFISAITILILLQKAPPFNPAVFITGIILLVSAYSLRIVTIRQFWASYNQEIIPSGKLVTTRIYSKIRHPLYFFYNLEMIAFILIKFNVISVIALIATVIAALIRIKQEEANLIDKFGADYKSYKTQTKKFIPYIY